MTSRPDIVDRLDPQARQSIASETNRSVGTARASRRPASPVPDSVSTLVADRAETQQADPIRTEAVNRLTVLGLAYAPQMSSRQARTVASRLYDWSNGDPELQLLIDLDFGEATRKAGQEWWSRETSSTERVWREAADVIDMVAGKVGAGDRQAELEQRDRQAEAAGPDAQVARVAEMSPAERERYIREGAAHDAVMSGLAGADPAGAGFAALYRMKTVQLADQVIEADRTDSPRRREIDRQAAAQATPEFAVALMAQALHEQGGTPTLGAATDRALQAFGMLSADQQSQLVSDVREMTTDQLVDAFKEEITSTSPTEQVIGEALTAALDTMATWDAVSHTLGIATIDGFLTSLGVETPEGGPIQRGLEDGWQAFRTSFESVKEGGLAGYYGLDPSSSMGSWVNIGSAVAFDLTTWVTGGGARAAEQTVRFMTSEAGADAFLAAARGRNLTRAIASTEDALELAPLTMGMSSTARLKLLTATDESVVADIIKDEIVNGLWMMNGPALAMRQQSILGAGEIGRHLGDKAKDLPGGASVSDWATEMLMRQNTTKTVALGEADFLDDVTELIVSRFPNDPGRAREALTEAYRMFDDYVSGGERLAAERVLASQELRRQSTQLWKETPSPIRQVPRARGRLNDVRNDRLTLDSYQAELSRQLDAATTGVEGARSIDEVMTDVNALDELYRTVDEQIQMLEGHVGRWGPEYDDVARKRAELLREAGRLRRANAEATRPRSRAALAQWVDGFMDDWGREIGVPENDLGQLMWGEVRTGARMHFGESASRLGPLESVAGEAAAVGFGETGTRHWLPATPLELALWHGAKEGGNLRQLAEISKEVAGRVASETLSTLNTFWAANLLFNPLNAAKAHLEDVYKFYTAGAPLTATLEALVSPVPATARWLANMPVRESGRVAQFVRQSITGLSERRALWTTIGPKERGHFEAAKRWLEGTVIGDEAFRVFAQAKTSGDPGVWLSWWDDVGQFKARATTVPLPGTRGTVRALNGEQAYQTMERVLEAIASGSKDAGEFSQILLDVAAKGGREAPSRLVRMAGMVPVEKQRVLRGRALNTGFDLLYGAPARARGAVFYDHYYDQASTILERRWSGRIIDDRTDDIVKAGLADSTAEAELMIAMRNPQLDGWLRSQGFITRARLEQEASKWAAKHAESLMYLGGASSRLGRGASKVMPFMPAQFDFVRWWSRQMFAGTDLALNRPAAAVVGALGKAAGDTAVGRGLTKLAEGSVHLPGVNARLASRWAHLAVESQRTGGEADWGPLGIIDRFTFLPVDFADPDQFLTDFGPGLGGLPTWVVHLLPRDHPIRDALTQVFPSLDWIAGQAEWNLDSAVKYLLPSTTKSLTGTIGWVARGMSTRDGWLGSTVEQLFADNLASPVFDWDRRPIGYTDVLKYQLGNLLSEHPDLVVGTGESDRLIADTINTALAEANGSEFWMRLGSYTGFASRFGADNQTIRHYGGLMARMDRLAESGVIGQAQADQLTGWWQQIQDGTATPEIRRLFGDQAASTLFDMPDEIRDWVIAENPELAVNMVSTIQCALDSTGQPVGPDEFCRPDGRVDTANPKLQGSQGAELRRQGFENGWFEPRPETEIAADVIYTYNDSRSRHARMLWERMTGRPYSDGMTKALDEATVIPDERIAAALRQIGVPVPSTSIKGADLRDIFRDAFASWPKRKIAVTDLPIFQRLDHNPELAPIADGFRQIEDRAEKAGVTSMWDWPDGVKALARDLIGEAIVVDPEIRTDYDRYLRPALGPLDWEPPVPPPVDQLDRAFRVDPQQVVAEDGDTIRVVTKDGDVRVRLIGLNAPEQGQAGYTEAWDQLTQVLENADDVTIGLWNPETYGAVQEVDQNTVRLIAWLYIDGVPLYDPNAFSGTNPRGIDVGGEPGDLAELLRQARERSTE